MPRALEDLREIAAFIARNNLTRARTFRDQLLPRALGLGHHPLMGRVVLEVDDEAVREIVHGAYRIIDEVGDNLDRIFVLRFWHGARGAPQLGQD